MTKKTFITLGVMALAMVGAAGCKEKKTAQTETPPAVSVKAAAASDETIPQDVEFTANIAAWQTNYIVPALQGARIRRIHVNVGDRVRKGQLVAEMDPTQYNAARLQAKDAEATYERLKKVRQAGGVSDQNVEQAEMAYALAKEQADLLAGHVKLYSPIDGVVTQKGEEEGNLFTSTPILELMQMDRLKVRVNVSEQYFTAVKVGTHVDITVDILAGETFEGKVSLIYPAIDPATRTFTVEVAIPNGGGKLRPGMFARSRINMGDKEAVMVPDVAVQKQVGTNERFVYVIEGGAAHRRVVTLGRQMGDRIDITSGLRAGESVATTSFSRLSDGSAVSVTQ